MRSGLLTVCFCAALLLPAGSSLADSFPVTSSADAGAGSLRTAIGEANATLGPDSIPISATGTIDLTSALPVLAESVDVSGPGVDRLTVSRDPAAPAFRIFDVGPAATVSISGMTIKGGKANEGGGVRSQGPLTLARVDVTQNLAPATGGNNATAQAGGIFSTGPLTLRESSVVENLAVAHDGSALTEARSGGLRALAGAVIVASNISLNNAEASSNTGTVLASIAGAKITAIRATPNQRAPNSCPTIEYASELKIAKTGTRITSIISNIILTTDNVDRLELLAAWEKMTGPSAE